MKRNRGATLTDAIILAVIFSSCLLLLLPVMLTASEDASSVKCMENLRELGKAHSLYHADFDDWFIPFNYSMEPYNVSYNAWNWPVGLLSGGYITSSAITLCPAGVEMNLQQTGLVRRANHPAWGIYVHYGYNYGYIGSSDQLGLSYPSRTHFEIWRPAKVFEIKNPSEKILNGDTPATYSFPYSAYTADARHGGGINILWADGNVSRMENPAAVLDGSQESKRKYLDRRF